MLQCLRGWRPPSRRLRLHPNLAELYCQKIKGLREALNREDTRGEATELFRSLTDAIRLVPEGAHLRVHLVGKLAALLQLGLKKQPGLITEAGLQVALVAGARSPLYRTILLWPSVGK